MSVKRVDACQGLREVLARAACYLRGAVAGITAIRDVTAVACLALSHFIPVSATGRESAMIPASQVVVVLGLGDPGKVACPL